MSSGLRDLITKVDKYPSPHSSSLKHTSLTTSSAPLDFQQNYNPYYRLFIHPDPHPHGYIHPKTISSISWPPTFTISHPSRTLTLTIPPSSATTSTEAINASLQQVVDLALASPLFPSLTI